MSESRESRLLHLSPMVIDLGWRARSEVDVEDLVESIGRIGQIQPISVTWDKASGPVLVSGYRRLLACKKLKIQVAAIIVFPKDELFNLSMQLEENIKRKQFDKLEIGRGLRRYKEIYTKQNHIEKGWNLRREFRKEKECAADFKSKPAERFVNIISKMLGLSTTSVYDMLTVASLPKETQDKLEKEIKVNKKNAMARRELDKYRAEKSGRSIAFDNDYAKKILRQFQEHILNRCKETDDIHCIFADNFLEAKIQTRYEMRVIKIFLKNVFGFEEVK